MNIYDIETFTEKDKIIPYCICYNINNEKNFLYYSENSDIVIEFLNKIVKLCNTDVTLFSHNINFDGMLIIESLTQKKIRFEWFIRDLDIYWIRVFFLNIEINLRCSYKIIPLSIQKIGELLEEKKKNFPYKFSCRKNLFYKGDHPGIEFYDNISSQEYTQLVKKNPIYNFKYVSIEYCFNDLLILEKVLYNIIKILNSYGRDIIWNSFSFSSIAYKIFKKKFDKFKICKKKLKVNEYEYIKNSYYGGRCEVFGNPKDGEIIHYFDFPGMYAQCMKKKFPIGKSYFKKNNLNIYDIGLHTVKVKSDNPFPILPSRHNNKIFFLNGEFIATYTHTELLFFLENGGKLINHYSSYVYEKEECVFKEYAEEFEKVRDLGIYFKIFGKSMNNGLYGSFALNKNNEETVIVFNEEEFYGFLENTDVKSWKRVNNCIIIKILKNNLSKKFLDKKNKWDEEDQRNLIYASYIASYARIKLYNGIKEILKNNGKLYYCDTDSFFAGFKNNYLNKSMGEITWSETFEDAVFISPKFYYTKNKDVESMKSKGIKSNHHSFHEIKKKFYSNEEDILFKDQLNFSKKDYLIAQKYLEKRTSLIRYDKRIFVDCKKKTIPLKISN